MKPALDRGLRKAGRTILQMAAAGSLTVLVDVLAHGLSPTIASLVLAVWGVIVVFLHNYGETKGFIPAILPTPGLVTTTPGGTMGKVVGTVDTVAEPAVEGATQVVGDVVSTTGKVVGAVAGTAGSLLGDVENLGGI
ncbi:MAG TPA: hypothetical protein VFI41_05315 [Gemmatimonadales bacterium]|nr:hypothetical protein [Gemmatimonadales bacterium]